MDREEARARVMAKMPRMTQQQARMYAVDRAIQESVVGAISAGGVDMETMDGPELDFVVNGIITVAKAIEAYVGEDEHGTCAGPDCEVCRALIEEARLDRRANLGLATTRDLMLELHTRGKVVHRKTNIEDAMLGLMGELEHDMATLNYRKVDHA